LRYPRSCKRNHATNSTSHCSIFEWEGPLEARKPEDLPVTNHHSRLSGEKHGM